MLLIAILFGIGGGVGMPSCLGYFADSTKITNRGLVGGIAFLGINIVAAVFSFLFTDLGLFVSWIILFVWRGVGLLVAFLKPIDQKPLTKTFHSSFKSIFSEKAFYLYFVVWFLFMLVDRSEEPTLRFVLDDLRYNVVAPIIGSISGLVAGVLADRIGRKKVIITGFVIFGVAYALIGLMHTQLFARYIFVTVEAISTGILWISFVLILWGDLSEFGSREKYYALGLVPFFLTSIIQLFSGPFFRDIGNESAFSLAAFFLFMTLLPLWVAPETVPEKNIELRRLKSFAEQAKKEREKFETNN
jgi:MFS family permease